MNRTPLKASEPVLNEALVYVESQPRGRFAKDIMADLKYRANIGSAIYGTPLAPHNGRDALIDLYEELLDGYMYAVQYEMEEGVTAEPLAVEVLDVLESVFQTIKERDPVKPGLLHNRDPQPEPTKPDFSWEVHT